MKRHVVDVLFTTLMAALATVIKRGKHADNSEVAPGGTNGTVALASGASQ
ncbi:hypothetical protein KQH60_14170 [Mycetohabitans sp. B8]|nr:hypothetical protein [Mycetohabitans sp. B8]MCG1043610.1 hypothetical protein [Mycetohabitans sp. B8]